LNPKLTDRLTERTCVCSLNATRRTHTRANAATERHTTVTPRGQGRRRLESACTTHNKRHPTRHQATFSSTPPRSCAASPPSMPPMTGRPNFTLPQACHTPFPKEVTRSFHMCAQDVQIIRTTNSKVNSSQCYNYSFSRVYLLQNDPWV
jgi:hypothetical protein